MRKRRREVTRPLGQSRCARCHMLRRPPIPDYVSRILAVCLSQVNCAWQDTQRDAERGGSALRARGVIVRIRATGARGDRADAR